MKVRILNRDIEVTKKRINIDNFKSENVLIGSSFNVNQWKTNPWKIIRMCIMPYKRLDNMFMMGKI